MKRLLCIATLTGAMAFSTGARAAETNSLPVLSEVMTILKTNLTGLSDGQLEKAAMAGLLEQFSERVSLVTNETAAAKPEKNFKTAVYDHGCGYIRVASLDPGAAQPFREACHRLARTNKLTGLIIDLRFSSGRDYDEAVAVADLFFSNAQVLMRRGDTVVRSTEKSDAISLPLVLLVNSKTSGAAEVLAAILHENKSALAIGSAPARPSRFYKEFTLSTGQKLRVATEAVDIGAPGEISLKAIEPDITAPVRLDDEKAYLEDPYQVLAQNAPALPAASTNLFPGVRRHPLNEAELVRMQKEGMSLDGETVSASKDRPKPVIMDPALARGIDFLKGLAVVQNRF